MITWQTLNEVNQSVPVLGMYSDCLRHCRRWQYYSDNLKSGIPTQAHECTHGIHSDLRNGFSQQFSIHPKSSMKMIPSPIIFNEKGMIYQASVPLHVFATGSTNAVYVGQDRFLLLPEPLIRKRDAAKVVPNSLRGPRYALYMSGQTAWDDAPLYVWDEWVAYRNGAQAACDAYDAGKYKERTDQPIGPIEFQIYGIAVLMATLAQGKSIDALLPFAQWHWKACWNTYHKSQQRFEWKTPLFEELRSGSSARPMRDWLKIHGFEDVPDTVVDGWPDGEDSDLTTDDFMTV